MGCDRRLESARPENLTPTGSFANAGAGRSLSFSRASDVVWLPLLISNPDNP